METLIPTDATVINRISESLSESAEQQRKKLDNFKVKTNVGPVQEIKIGMIDGSTIKVLLYPNKEVAYRKVEKKWRKFYEGPLNVLARLLIEELCVLNGALRQLQD